MAVSSVSCVCWEWQRDDGGFSPYIPFVSNAIEADNHAGMGAHNSGSYTIDFARMIQQKNATGYERQVQRRQIVLPSTPDITAYWMWNEHGAHFVLYDIQSSVDIELAYVSGTTSVDLSKCTSRLPYTIDFHRMEQTRHGYNTRRKIQRCQLLLGCSLQSLLALAPGITSLTGLAAGGSGTAGMMMPHGTGGGSVYHPTVPGYGSGSFPASTPLMMNPATLPPATGAGHMTKSGGVSTSTPSSVPGTTPSLSATHTSKSGMVSTSTPALINSMTTGPTPSFPTGGVVGKSGGLTTMGGLTSKSSPTSKRAATKTKTKTLAVLGAIAPVAAPSTNYTVPPTTTAARPHTGSTSSSTSNLPPPSMTNAATTSPQKRRRGNKTTASNSTGHASNATTSSSISSMAAATSSSRGGGPATSAAIKAEKSKARRRRREKKGASGGGGYGSRGYNDETSKYARKKKKLKKGEDGPCPICMNELSEDSGFGDDDQVSSSPSPLNVCKLRKCGHMLHHPCLIMYIKNSSNGGFQCPTCKKSYGVKTGDMPDGNMSVRSLPSTQLPGHEGYGTIEITYNFRPGVYNGRRYNASAFPRVCYLPDSPQGQKVLKLLRIAWERHLTFTIGTSVTSGMTDTVVWNEIHHKTTIQNYSGHGYPDPGYLDRVTLELAAQGVTEDGPGSDNEQGSSSSSSEDEDEDKDKEVIVVGGVRHGETKANAIILDASSDESDL